MRVHRHCLVGAARLARAEFVAQRWIDLKVDSITTNRAGWLREQLKL